MGFWVKGKARESEGEDSRERTGKRNYRARGTQRKQSWKREREREIDLMQKDEKRHVFYFWRFFHH